MRKIILIMILIINSHLFASNKWEMTYDVDGIPQALDILDSNNLYISSTQGLPNWLYRSTDQGRNWYIFFNDFQHVEYNNDLSLPDSMNMFLIFDGGVMFTSNDGGKSFESKQLDSVNTFNEISMFDKNIGVLTNAYIYQNIYHILITFDGWKTFDKFFIEKSKISAYYRAPNLINDSILFCVVYDSKGSPFDTYLLKLNIISKKYELNFIDKLYEGIFDLCVVNENLLFVCGKSNTISGGSGNDAIYKSTDGGKTWRRVLNLYFDKKLDNIKFSPPFGLQSIAFRDSLTGIAVGQFGKIVYTYDGGETWIYEDSLHPTILKTTPATMIVRYAGSMPVIATFGGQIYRLAQDNMAPAPDDVYNISGRVWEGDRGQAGIPIACGYRVTMTDSAGYYHFTRLAKGKTYTIKALNKYYDGVNPDFYYRPFAYHPDDYVIDLSHDTTGFDFNAEDLRVFYSVGGSIKNKADSAIADITLKIDDSVATSDASGNYFFPKIERGNRTITPIDANFSFTPKSYYFNLQNDTTALNFTAEPTTAVAETVENNVLNIRFTDSKLFVESEIPLTGMTVIISDILGREVVNAPLQNEMDLSRLRPGLYLVSVIKSGLILKTEKFIIVK